MTNAVSKIAIQGEKGREIEIKNEREKENFEVKRKEKCKVKRR